MMDIMYTQDLANEPLKMLGMIDCATLYHVVVQLPDCNPSTIVDLVTSMWLTPFGNMSTIVMVKDGSFFGDFLTAMNDLHIEVQ